MSSQAPAAPPPPAGEPLNPRPPSWDDPAPISYEPEQRAPRPWWRRFGSALIVAGLLALKFGKAALLLLTKAKFLATSASMLVSIVAYSFIWGWKFAVGIVALLLVHELGHAIQMRREGIAISGMMFIPFLGAAVFARSLGDDATAEARVGLAGPVLGTLGTLALLPIALTTGEDFWLALIFTGLFLNLFNLLPVVPLDGGRAMAALSPWMWFVGLFAMALLTFVYPNPILILILLFAMYDTYRRWKAYKAGGAATQAYYRVKPAHRLVVLAVYLGLIVVCAVGMGLTHIQRDIPS